MGHFRGKNYNAYTKLLQRFYNASTTLLQRFYNASKAPQKKRFYNASAALQRRRSGVVAAFSGVVIKIRWDNSFSDSAQSPLLSQNLDPVWLSG